MYHYSPENARVYSQLAIVGTTYEISFNEVRRLLGNLQGKIALDFGTGTGRSAHLLRSLGAERVIGVDRDENMIAQAQASRAEKTAFYLLRERTIPLQDASVDLALSAHVMVEMRTLAEMEQAMGEIARVLKPGGTFIVVSTNPSSIGHEFKSYAYVKKPDLKSSDPVTCIVKGETAFEIRDIYWVEEDYRRALASAGFAKIRATFPLGEGEQWLDEKKVAPDIVFTCVKAAGNPVV